MVQQQGVNPIRDGHFWGCSRMGGGGGSNPTVVKFGTVIPYLKKIQKINESRDTPPDFC